MLPGEVLARPKIGSEIPIEKLYPEFLRRPFRRFPHELMVLVGADEQGGGKGVKAAFRRHLGSSQKAHFIALAAAVGDVLRHRTDKGAQSVLIPFNELQIDLGGIVPQTVATGTVLRKGVDIGVVPEARDLQAVGAQHLNALVGTGGAADMQ